MIDKLCWRMFQSLWLSWWTVGGAQGPEDDDKVQPSEEEVRDQWGHNYQKSKGRIKKSCSKPDEHRNGGGVHGIQWYGGDGWYDDEEWY